MNQLTIPNLFLKICMLLCSLLIAPFAMGYMPYNLYALGYTGGASTVTISNFVESDANEALVSLQTLNSAVGYGSWGLVVSPDYRFVYRSDACGTGDCHDSKGFIENYTTDSTGNLAYINKVYMNTPDSMVIGASGKYLYVINGDGTNLISKFDIDATTGDLINKQDTNISDTLRDLEIDVTGSFLYVSSYNSKCYRYKIDANNGSLTFDSSVGLKGVTNHMALDPAKSYLYSISGNYIQTLLTPYDGAITTIFDQSLGGYYGDAIILSPDGNILYVATDEPSMITYAVNRATGELTQIDKFNLSYEVDSGAMSFDATAKVLYLGIKNTGSVGSILAFNIDKSSRKLVQTTSTTLDKYLGYIISPMRTTLYNAQITSDPDMISINTTSSFSQEFTFTVQSNTGYDLINIEKSFDISSDNSDDINISIIDDQCGSIIYNGDYCTITALVTTNSSIPGIVTMHISGNYEYYAEDGVNLLVTPETYDYPTFTIELNQNNKYAIFVTNRLPEGEFYVEAGNGSWGVYAADELCRTDSNNPNDGQTYKAMIADNSYRYACYNGLCGEGNSKDWVLKANTTYYNTRGETIAKTTKDAIFTFPLDRPMSPDISDRVWTGLTTAFGADDDCKDWNSNSNDNKGRHGDSSATDSSSISEDEDKCDMGNRLYCVSQ